MNAEQAEKKIAELREKNQKVHFTELRDEYQKFCIEFLELMPEYKISHHGCSVFKELAFPISAQNFDNVLKYAEIYLGTTTYF
ncbi:MAG: hypothetical protein ACYDIA_02370 [Candidatus Humimicrobiaceae bacterium]